jgi:MFS family permease
MRPSAPSSSPFSALARTLDHFSLGWSTLNRNAQLYVISNTLQAATAGAVAVLYTLYLTALGFHTDFIGAVLVIATIGGGLGIIPANPLVRRLGWRAMLIWSDIIGGVAIAAQILLPTAPVIIITSLGIGASVAIFLVINTPLLTAYSTPRERTALFGLNNATNFLATIIGTLLGGFLPGWFAQRGVDRSPLLLSLHPLLVSNPTARSYELALLATGALALPSIIPVLFIRDPPRELAQETAPTQPQVAPAIPLLLFWRKRLREGWGVTRRYAVGFVGRFSLTQALVGFGAGVFFPYVNLYFVNTLHANVAYYGALSAVLSVVVALASLVAAPLAARFGKMRTAIMVQVLSIPFLIAVGLAPFLWLVSLVYLIRGALMAINNPPLQTFLMEGVEKEQRIAASSIYNVSFQVAWAMGAGLSGWLITLAGNRLPFFVAAPFYAASALLLIIWFG